MDDDYQTDEELLTAYKEMVKTASGWVALVVELAALLTSEPPADSTAEQWTQEQFAAAATLADEGKPEEDALLYNLPAWHVPASGADWAERRIHVKGLLEYLNTIKPEGVEKALLEASLPSWAKATEALQEGLQIGMGLQKKASAGDGFAWAGWVAFLVVLLLRK